jgi:ornithine carbamoyltransferase
LPWCRKARGTVPIRYVPRLFCEEPILEEVKKKRIKPLKGLKVVYAGDIWNVCHSLMIAAATMGFDIYVTVPDGYSPNPKVYQFAAEAAKRNGTKMVLTQNMKEALKDADVVYANTWHSMGAAEKEKESKQILGPSVLTRFEKARVLGHAHSRSPWEPHRS